MECGEEERMRGRRSAQVGLPADGGELDFCGCGQGRGSNAGAAYSKQRNVWRVVKELQQNRLRRGFI